MSPMQWVLRNRRLPSWLKRILKSSGLLHSVRRFYADVSRLPVGPLKGESIQEAWPFKIVPKPRYQTTWRCVTTQKTEEFKARSLDRVAVNGTDAKRVRPDLTGRAFDSSTLSSPSHNSLQKLEFRCATVSGQAPCARSHHGFPPRLLILLVVLQQLQWRACDISACSSRCVQLQCGSTEVLWQETVLLQTTYSTCCR
jgi:hypothetical protein